jgi:hypothetical protein
VPYYPWYVWVVSGLFAIYPVVALLFAGLSDPGIIPKQYNPEESSPDDPGENQNLTNPQDID